MSKLPPINPALPPVWLPMGRKSHPNERNDQKLTERAQRESCLAWAKRQIERAGRGEVDVVPWEFDDDTGLNADRPAYRRRLARARELRTAGRQVYWLVGVFDRLGRDGEELHRAYKELCALDVELHDVSMGGYVSPQVFPYLVANAHVGSVTIGANVKRANDQVRRDGWWRPGKPTWGYKSAPATPAQEAAGAPKAVLAIDEPARPKVQEAWDRAAAGESVHAIARWVATLTAAQRGGYQTKDGWHARNLDHRALAQVFRSRTYLGEQPDGAPGKWSPLIDQATWDKVQAQLGLAHRVPQQASRDYLLTGLLWCPVCARREQHARMRGWSEAPRPGRHLRARRYLCASGTGGAAQPVTCYYSVLVADTDADIRRQVGPLLRVAKADRGFRRDVEGAVRALLAEGQRPKGDVQARLADLDAKITAIQREGDVLLDKLGKKLLRDREFTRRMEPLRSEEDRLQGERDGLAALLPAPAPGEKLSAATVMRHLDAWGERWATDDRPTQRGVLVELVARVEPKRAENGAVRCHVEWTEEGALLAATAKALGLVPDEPEQVAGDGQGEAAAG